MKNLRFHWSKISLVFLFVVALIGTLLRSPYLIPVPLKYSNLVHAHSHVAFQGWIYTLIILLLPHLFLRKPQIQQGRYPLQFKLTVVVIVGVLVSFSLQGYALYSIIFSTLFQLLNYWFIFRFFKDIRRLKNDPKNTIPLYFIKTGLWLGLLSTLVPIAIGILSAKDLNGSEIYRSAIYTFLHLQYNGWFLFIAIGIFYKILELKKIAYNREYAKKFYWLFTIAVIPAISLSLLGMSYSRFVIPVTYIVALLQTIGLLFFLMSLSREVKAFIFKKNRWFQLYIWVFLVSFFIKVILQSLSVLPVFKPFAFHNKPIMLAYLHLSLIGVITCLFLAVMIHLKWLAIDKFSKLGNILFVIGFVATELMLVYGGIGLSYNNKALSIGSATIALGVLLLIISRNNQIKQYG